MIYIKHEGDLYRYGLNLEWNRGNTLFQIHLMLPYGKFGPLYYHHFHWDSMAYGQIVKKVRVGFRIRFRIKPRILFHFSTNKTPVNPKYIACRETIEDIAFDTGRIKEDLLDRLPSYI